MAKRKTLDDYVQQALENIEKDREITTELLKDAAQYIGKDEHRHAEVGHVAAKYIESLQRSNEQLVKLTAIMMKRESSIYGDLNDTDKNEIYNSLNEES
jgi:hypothetical protein